MQFSYLGRKSYDGAQLRHAFAYEQAGILGPSIVCFTGKADVKDHLVDLEDSLADDLIRSKEMLHFIIEIPEASIREAVVWQRLFIYMIARKLELRGTSNMKIVGDDIFVRERKLSVSIATLSQFSGLIHVGLNIVVGEDCPVAAIGLSDCESYRQYCGEQEIAEFGKEVMREFSVDYNDIVKAMYKVREV